MLQSLIPDLAKHRIKVVVSPRSLQKRGEYRPDTKTICLYARGQNEGTLLHEIAHVTNPVTRGKGTRHIIHGAGFKTTLLHYEKVWRRHNKLRTRRDIVRVPDETSESQPPKKTRVRSRCPLCASSSPSSSKTCGSSPPPRLVGCSCDKPGVSGG